VSKKQKKPEEELKKYIIVIDYARFDNLKLYGAGVAENKYTDLLGSLRKKFPYVGELRSKQKRRIVSNFPEKIKHVEDYVDLVASTDLNRVLDSIESYVKHSTEVIVDPVVYGRFRERFPDVIAKKEDKNLLRRSGKHAIEALLNIVDTFMRWVKSVVGKAKFVFVRIKHGKRRIKVK